ncbi:MAG TPA: Flp pilus assembly protein CpaB [Gaiellaceae bacterium]|nr:Flp pilus assembly protein CpaB [Gaiellaceae bacterium]
MNATNRLWHVVAAAGLALLAVLLTTFYVTNYKRHVQHGEAQVTVLVAAKDIPVDTQGADLLSGTWLRKETVARRQVVPGAITSADQVRGLIAVEPVFAGEQVTTRRFGTPAERGVRAQLKGTQRVVSVTGDQYQLLAGTLRPGDHVDVVGGWSVDNSSGSDNVARVFVRDALVLEAPATPKTGGGLGPAGGYGAQLRMSDADSQRLEWMVAHGKDWRVEIRPSADAANSPRSYDTGDTLLKDGAGRR